MNSSSNSSRENLEKQFLGIEITKEQLVEEFIEDQNNCCLCGSSLKFDHKIDYLTLHVKEDAHCPSCRIQMRSRDHVLQ